MAEQRARRVKIDILLIIFVIYDKERDGRGREL